jgi:small subunit ribosomal protein S16
MGSKKNPFYRLVATDSRMPRDGRFIETLGFYNPMPTPAEVKLDEEAVFKWFERGAVPTTSAASLLRRVGYLQKWELMKQGMKGEDLNAKVQRIVMQQDAAESQREERKREQVSSKAKAKAAEKAEKPAEAEAEAPKPDAAADEAAGA